MASQDRRTPAEGSVPVQGSASRGKPACRQGPGPTPVPWAPVQRMDAPHVAQRFLESCTANWRPCQIDPMLDLAHLLRARDAYLSNNPFPEGRIP